MLNLSQTLNRHILNQHLAAINAAVACGVKHVIYTSLTNPHPHEEGTSIPNFHFWSELELMKSKVNWTILRFGFWRYVTCLNHSDEVCTRTDSIFSEFALITLKHSMKSGKLFSAIGISGRSYVTRADCALVATNALVKADGKLVSSVST